MIGYLLSLDNSTVDNIASAILFPVAVENFFIRGVNGRADAVILMDGRGEIADKDQHIAPILSLSDEGDNTVLCVVAVNPFEALTLEIYFVKGGLIAI